MDRNSTGRFGYISENDGGAILSHPLLLEFPPGPPFNISDHGIVRMRSMAHNDSAATRTPIPVVVWPYIEIGASGNAEVKHIEENGIHESPFLYMSTDLYNFDTNVIWIGDTGEGDWDSFCLRFLEIVIEAKKKRSILGLPLSWPIFIVDWTDYPVPMRCRAIEGAVGKEFVSYSHRSITDNRRWNHDAGWVELGDLIDVERYGVTYRHTPLIVRTDTVAHLADTLGTKYGVNLSFPIETLDRPVDVTHIWPLDGKGVGTIESNLREKVSRVIADMAAPSNSDGGSGRQKNLTAYIGLAGEAARDGRRGVKSEYIEALLGTKIVVVTQRDCWEDHYRLFEALVSGAMVLMDRMLSLPAGLENGTSVVEFTSEESLRSLIWHYLDNPDERRAVAREGRRVAMTRHRSWHRMEEIVFGEVLSNCSKVSAASSVTENCPYSVHFRQ